MRYVVTEIEGYYTTSSGNSRGGLSYTVSDTAWNHRAVATFLTEALNGQRWHVRTQGERLAIVREQAVLEDEVAQATGERMA